MGIKNHWLQRRQSRTLTLFGIRVVLEMLGNLASLPETIGFRAKVSDI